MAKPKLNCENQRKPADPSPRYPWLKTYPKGIDWSMRASRRAC